MNLPRIYLGSILLEPDRWKPGRPASIRVSEWADRAAAAGFAGWELWENHDLLAAPAERAALRHGSMSVRIFNTYAAFGAGDPAECNRALAAAREFPNLTGLKFNVGPDPAATAAHRAGIAAARAALPPSVRLLCECHPGTMLETPAALAAFAPPAEPWPFDVIVHPFLEGPEVIAAWLAVAGPHAVHAHVQMRNPRNAKAFLRLADDPVRARECLAALAEGGFAGTFTLEFSAPTLTDRDRPEFLFAAAQDDLEFLLVNGPAPWNKPAGP